MKFFILISFVLTAKSCFGQDLLCYSCNSGQNPNCGDNMVDVSTIGVSSCSKSDEYCVTFYNRFDNNNIYRGCSGTFYVPEELETVNNTCVLDPYTKSVFCNCNENLCNKGEIGTIEIANKDECLSNPCLNGATCVDLYNKYECNCAANYTGIHCDSCIPGNQGDDCSEIYNPCESNPCANNGTCVPNKDVYTCKCSTGFFGEFCTLRIDPCGKFPCLNGGICTDLYVGNEYKCDCSGTGFNGTDCENDVDECSLGFDQCVNGTCFNLGGSYGCNCSAGFKGKYCDIDINECESNPCKNGATCSDKINGYECACVKGYNGTDCENDIDECASVNCTERGKCNDYIGYYDCTCDSGFSGKDCEIDIDECASNPCMNRASCTDLENGYNCTCLPGYYGTNCENETNECESNPCQNGGTCVDKLARYTCTCSPGFQGQNCELDIDECASSPCYSGGSTNCTDKINDYFCECTNGFFGKNCEDITPPKPCNEFPCKNGATCINTVDGLFVCECANGFNGTTCTEKVENYCLSKKCDRGTPVSDPIQKTCECDCEEGFSGDLCDIETFTCPGLGTYPDPEFCWIYYTCTQGATGIEKVTKSCPLKLIGSKSLQLLFNYDPSLKEGTCTFPSTFTGYTGKTCSES